MAKPTETGPPAGGYDAMYPIENPIGVGLGSSAVIPNGFGALLVEDSAVIAMDLEALLLEHGAAKVVSVMTVRDGLDALERGGIDVALLDINLGEETSLPLAERLVEMGVPFAISTGYEEQHAQIGAFAQRPFLEKPHSSSGLKTALEQAFSATRR